MRTLLIQISFRGFLPANIMTLRSPRFPGQVRSGDWTCHLTAAFDSTYMAFHQATEIHDCQLWKQRRHKAPRRSLKTVLLSDDFRPGWHWYCFSRETQLLCLVPNRGSSLVSERCAQERFENFMSPCGEDLESLSTRLPPVNAEEARSSSWSIFSAKYSYKRHSPIMVLLTYHSNAKSLLLRVRYLPSRLSGPGLGASDWPALAAAALLGQLA